MLNHEEEVKKIYGGTDPKFGDGLLKQTEYFTRFEGQLKRLVIKWPDDEKLRCVAFRTPTERCFL